VYNIDRKTKEKEVRKMTNIKCIDNFPTVERKVNAIREFAKAMGYTTNEYYYKVCYPTGIRQYSRLAKLNGTDAFCVELNGTSDGDGYPYCWQWSMVTGQEL
jgi:hypothetical protein